MTSRKKPVYDRDVRRREDNVVRITPPAVGVLLSCGCRTRQYPQLTNTTPPKWWCVAHAAWVHRVRDAAP